MGRPIQKYLVVARYKEDISWVKDYPGWQVIVIQKATEDVEGDMPNVGREPTSFALAIKRYYHSIRPDDIWAFVQGRPFDHCPSLMEDLQRDFDRFRWLGSPTKKSDGDGKHDHPGLPVAEKYGQWLGKEFPGSVDFAAGGQHMVKGEVIKSRPLSFYKELGDDLVLDYNPWVAERLWASIYE